MNNKKDKKNTAKIVISTLFVILICALCFFASMASSKDDKYSESNSSSSSSNSGSDITSTAQAESSSIKDDEKGSFNDISVDSFVDIYNGSDKKIVLFSRPTCGYCQIAEPILQNIIYKYNITINHVNTDEISEDDFTKLEKTDSAFADFGTPFLVVAADGKLIDKVNGFTNTAGYLEFFQKNGFISE